MHIKIWKIAGFSSVSWLCVTAITLVTLQLSLFTPSFRNSWVFYEEPIGAILLAILIHQTLSFETIKARRDIACLRLLGIQSSLIFVLLLVKGVTLAVAGVSIGLMISYAYNVAMTKAFAANSGLILTALGIAVVGAILGSLPSSRSISKMDISEVLRA